jgi:hypothetical protein
MAKLLIDTRYSANSDAWPRMYLYGGWRLGKHTKTEVQSLANDHPFRLPAILNIEHWPLPEHIGKYIDIVNWWREIRPDVRVGYYSMLPYRNYWAPVLWSLNQRNSMEAWKAANQLLRPLAEVVDFVCPSLYTFYEDGQSGPDYSHDDLWEVYARANIDEARKYNKQVYPFIWPRFHISNQLVGLQYIGDELLRRQIRVCVEHADGCIVWDDPSIDKGDGVLTKTSAIMREFT